MNEHSDNELGMLIAGSIIGGIFFLIAVLATGYAFWTAEWRYLAIPGFFYLATRS